MSTPISSNLNANGSVQQPSVLKSERTAKEHSAGSQQSNHSIQNNLRDISSIVDSAKSSSPGVRPDKVALAKALINDPDWFDSNLDSLAEKLISVEKF
jgi:hypothetical protein